MRYLNLLLALTILLFWGCVSLDKVHIENRTQKMPLDPISITMDSEIYFVRADLVRDIHSDNKRYIMPYHYLGIRLGNGIFLDLNENLCVDLLEFYHIDKNNFRLTRQNGISSIDYLSANSIFTSNEKTFSIISKTTNAEIGKERINVTENSGFKKQTGNSKGTR